MCDTCTAPDEKERVNALEVWLMPVGPLDGDRNAKRIGRIFRCRIVETTGKRRIGSDDEDHLVWKVEWRAGE